MGSLRTKVSAAAANEGFTAIPFISPAGLASRPQRYWSPNTSISERISNPAVEHAVRSASREKIETVLVKQILRLELVEYPFDVRASRDKDMLPALSALLIGSCPERKRM